MAPSNIITTTALITLSILLIGLPIAIAAILLTQVSIPNVVLGTKEIDAGPKGPKTITFGLLTSSDDAVLASSYIMLATSIISAAAIVLLRHTHKASRVLGWTLLGATAANVLAQLACVVAWATLQEKNDAQTAVKGTITFTDGKYDAGGRMFTREAWACSMNELFKEREGAWANKACEVLMSSRYLTIVATMCAFALLAMAYWQVLSHGGVAWLMGRTEQKADVKDISDVESVDSSR